MTRSCCVQGCKSGKIVPSHGIPTNKERRKRWLQILKLNITDEDVIKQLRVCHKHFHENDYSCSSRYRRLINTAVPCMELACPEEVGTQLQQEEVFQQQTEMTISQKGEEIQERMEVLHQQQERMKVLYHQQQQEMEVLHQQQKERMEMLSQKQDKIQERMEMLHHEQEERIEMMSQEQEEIQDRMEMLYHEREEKMKMLSQKQEEIQERMEMLHYQQQEKIEVLSQKQEEIEKQLIKDNKHTLSARRRPNLLKITRQSTLNSQARLFYQKVIKLQRDQRRLKQMVRKMKQERTSNRITHSTTDHRGRKDKTSLIRQQILDLIIRHDKVAPQARRYTLEEKMFCLSLFKRSRTSYNFLSTYLHLPSHVILKKQLRNIPIDTGCNKSILQYLCLIKKEIDPKDLYVVLIWDEMYIQPAVQYDPKNDIIIGLEDWGTKRTRKIADHAIVFYIRCLASGKHMPIGYGFSHSATNSIQLARCIKEWLLALIKCGFKPVATVCDQGGTNIAAINLLIQQTRPALHGNESRGHIKDNTIFVKDHKIIPLFDYVHLQKGVRNNLLTKHLMLNKNVSTDLKCPYATWDAIERLYTIDKLNKYSDIQQRMMPKLVDKHIYPNLIPKMRVKYAVQVLSHTVARYMAIVVSYKQGK